MVVLINADTASAAEIVAGALRLHGRAVLVGARTRGKGCVQSMFRLPGGLGQINLTTSELLIGKRQPIVRAPDSNVWGVSPHLEEPVYGQIKRQAVSPQVITMDTGDGFEGENLEVARLGLQCLED